jgi:hypothetical protein
MRTIEYVKLFETHYRLRIRFDSDQGRVIRFLVQLERDLGGWTPIVRYDTAHGYAHCDILHPRGEHRKIPMPTQDYNQALTYAVNDLTENREVYWRRYQAWLRQL